MTAEELITALFYEVDEQMRAIPKHPEAPLWPSEVVTLGLLPRCGRAPRGARTAVGAGMHHDRGVGAAHLHGAVSATLRT